MEIENINIEFLDYFDGIVRICLLGRLGMSSSLRGRLGAGAGHIAGKGFLHGRFSTLFSAETRRIAVRIRRALGLMLPGWALCSLRRSVFHSQLLRMSK